MIENALFNAAHSLDGNARPGEIELWRSLVTREVNAGSGLVYVDRGGNNKVLGKNNVGARRLSLRSPDGRYLTIQNSTYKQHVED